jgi:hypothetical protein
MKRSGANKKSPVERRKRPRGKSSTDRRSAASPGQAKAERRSPKVSRGTHHAPLRAGAEDACYHCAKSLSGDERALFVEEEIGRVFCSEQCITSYFTPEIERLEKTYLRKISSGDLSAEERESLAHLRWITLQEADEVWREKTLTGDFRYTLISEFQPGSKRVWCVCICLFLRGEPSFLYIAFTTRSQAMVAAYRRGERMQWEKKPAAAPSPKRGGKSAGGSIRANATRDNEKDAQDIQAMQDARDAEQDGTGSSDEDGGLADLGDRLAGAWTEDETFLAQVNMERRADDIPPTEFELFQGCLEETLETPDEVWSVEMTDPEGVRLYHFIREYTTEQPGHWYVIVARETENEEQIEILDAFPTRDSNLVDRYRRGTQEVGESSDNRASSRMVH